MIKIFDSNWKRVAILKEAENPYRLEEINGENTLSFSAAINEKVAKNVNENSIIELDNDYFDLVYYEKKQAENGLLTIDVQSEHVSYRLNNPEYNIEFFNAYGTPEAILTQILAGTEFTAGTVEFAANTTYSAQEAKSRRQLLIEFVNLLGGELDFDKFTISIVTHRGSTTPKLLVKGKNIKVVSKIYDGRQKDENGNALVSYSCEPIQMPSTQFALGDEALLIQKDLGIQQQMRIVKYGYNPYNNIEASIELANFISSLEDQFYNMEMAAVRKDSWYYGTRIGPENGIEIKRSDGASEVVLNSDEVTFKADGEDALYFDILTRKFIFNGTLEAVDGVFSGTISWANIEDKPVDLVYEDALADYVTNGALSATLADYLTSGDFSTLIGLDYIVTGKIAANQIAAGLMTGVTIQTAGDTNYISLNEQYLDFFMGDANKMSIGFKDFLGVMQPYIKMGSGTADGGYDGVGAVGTFAIVKTDIGVNATFQTTNQQQVQGFAIYDSGQGGYANGATKFIGTIDFTGTTQLGLNVTAKFA